MGVDRVRGRRFVAGVLALVVVIAGLVIAASGQVAGAAGCDQFCGYQALSPARVLDTRTAGPVGARQTVSVQITGRGGVPPSGVAAVVVNLTGTAPTASTFVTAFPAGESRPMASTLNLVAGQTAPNLAVVKVGTGGQISLYNNAGSVHLLADVVGWFPVGSDYTALSPARLLDTRSSGAVAGGQSTTLQVTGRGGVPSGGVGAVVVNLTGTDPTASTFVTAYPAGEPRPLASNLNLARGQTAANLAVVKVGAGGQISLYNNTGAIHLLADIVGWFPTGPQFTALTPARVLDTRTTAAVTGGRSIDVQITGRGGVPADGVAAVVVNLTGTDPTASTFVTAYPAGEPRPTASNLNVVPGQTRPNLAIVKIGAGGRISLFNNTGSTHLLADVVGWFPEPVLTDAEPTPLQVRWSTPSRFGAFAPNLTAPTGEVTTPCPGVAGYTADDVVTYDIGGETVRRVPRSDQVDGKPSCIRRAVVDRHGTLYGIPVDGNGDHGPNLLSIGTSKLRWKYPIDCPARASTRPVVGADGNIYFINGDGRLIGVSPNAPAGATRPVKVADFPVAGVCGDEVRALRDGFAVIRSAQWRITYYTMTGTERSTHPGGGFMGDLSFPITATGRYFSPKESGPDGAELLSVAAYDPGSTSPAWTTSLWPTATFNLFRYQVYPLPSGGAAVVVQGWYGEPDFFTEVVVLSADGRVARTTVLPRTDQDDNRIGFVHAVAVDGNGRLVVQRGLSVTVDGTWPYPKGSSLTVVDTGTGRILQQSRLLDDADGGYSSENNVVATLPLGPGTAYLNVQRCTPECTPSSPRSLLAVAVPGIGLDYPRSEILATGSLTPPTPAPLRTYVAMGDSYSSGQGAGDYDAGTVTDTNTCYRSANAYAHKADQNPFTPVRLTAFPACGGSITSDIHMTWSNPDSPPQLDTLSADTDVVSLSIGGNDIGFGDVIIDCALPIRDCDAAFTNADGKISFLDVLLQDTYLKIMNKAKTADIYVLGYPPIVTTGPGCYLGGATDAPFFTEERKQKAVDLLAKLNTRIHDTVNIIRSLGPAYERLHFIDPTLPTSPFQGHDVCATDPYVTGLNLGGDLSESFHPNAKGQQAYADLLATYLQ